MKKSIILILVIGILVSSLGYSIKEFIYIETELVSLAPEAEDPDEDNLIYNFSSPLNQEGEWQTTYGDAGEHIATVSVSDGENIVEEDIKIIIYKKEAIQDI